MGQPCCKFVEFINKNAQKKSQEALFLGQDMALLTAK